MGFTESIVTAASLVPGQRVAWWGGTFRTVDSIELFEDGTDHLNVLYRDGNGSARYAGNGLVRVVEVCPIPVPAC